MISSLWVASALNSTNVWVKISNIKVVPTLNASNLSFTKTGAEKKGLAKSSLVGCCKQYAID